MTTIPLLSMIPRPEAPDTSMPYLQNSRIKERLEQKQPVIDPQDAAKLLSLQADVFEGVSDEVRNGPLVYQAIDKSAKALVPNLIEQMSDQTFADLIKQGVIQSEKWPVAQQLSKLHAQVASKLAEGSTYLNLQWALLGMHNLTEIAGQNSSQ